jgi:aminoglycoside 6'-N-acetyltransferase I
LSAADSGLLEGLDDTLFDNPVDPAEARAFLADPANLVLLAMAGDTAVGMATATVLRHPDKPPALYVQEVGTQEDWQRQGIARAMMARMLDEGRRRGCAAAWLLTEEDNAPALGLYRAIGGAETTGIVMFDLATGTDDTGH